MKLLCLSDIHGEGAGLAEILAEVSSSGVDVVVVAGDLTHLGGYADAESVLAPLLAFMPGLLCVAGNMDGPEARRFIAEKGIDIHGRGVAVGGIGFIGLGGGTPSPFGTPWELPAEEARAALAAGLAAVAGCPHKVLVSHAPPRGTRLDRSFAGLHAGSQPVREFILAGSVDLCICGHIHEAAGEEMLGRTLCVNVGPFKNGSYALVDLEGSHARVTWRKR
jgi:Icc-related predicted phosphoesterase